MVSSPIATERRHKTAVRPRPMKRSKYRGAYKKKAAQSDNLATFAAYRCRLLGRGCTYARGRNLQTVSHYEMGSAHQPWTLSRSHQCGSWMHATSSRIPRRRYRALEKFKLRPYRIFCLTRVTRIFQKSIFTKTTRRPPPRCRRVRALGKVAAHARPSNGVLAALASRRRRGSGARWLI